MALSLVPKEVFSSVWNLKFNTLYFIKERTIRESGFSLLELIVVIITIGILVSMAFPLFTKTKESALDKEAKANLKLIIAAEKIYRMESGAYFASSSITTINDNLRLSLSSGSNRNWDYITTANGGISACAQATRYNGPDTRTWSLLNTEEEPVENGTCQ